LRNDEKKYIYLPNGKSRLERNGTKWVFANPKTNTHYNNNTFYKALHKADENITFHEFRHTCISNWIEAKEMSIEELRKCAGYESVATTLRVYAHVTKKEINREAFNKSTVNYAALSVA